MLLLLHHAPSKIFHTNNVVPCALAHHTDAIQWLIRNIIAICGIQGTKSNIESLNFYDSSREGGWEGGCVLCACHVPCVAMKCLV